MNRVLMRSFALALAGALALMLAGCSLFGPSKTRSYTYDRGICNGCGASHGGQSSQK